MPIAPGDELNHYRLIEQIGAGGMGVVWKALDTKLAREVAVKMLPEAFASDPTRVERFGHEARLAAALNHPNIATIHGLEQCGEVTFLVMELVPGETLAERLARGPLAIDEALPLFRQMAEAVGLAHEQGIIHRDLKPSNIKITPAGRVKILDFGLAKALVDASRTTAASHDTPTKTRDLTDTGLVMGTASYMSPEQLQGKTLDARSDLFQLGLIYFLAVTGHHPFEGPTAVDVQHSILRGEPRVDLAGGMVPEELLRIVLKLLEKLPQYRYPDARALAVDLRTLQRDTSSGSAMSTGVHPRRRGRPWAVIVPVVLLVGIVGIAVAVWLVRAPDVDAPALPSRLFPLPEARGDNDAPSISPDGSSVVFCSDRGGQWDLWVTLVSGGDPVQITDSPEVESDPAYSPDGTRVAFARDAPGGRSSSIYVMPALGGAARRVAERGGDPAWSPDGGSIALVTDHDGWTRVARVATDPPGELTFVTEPEQGFFHRRPAWSPDGRYITYVRSAGGTNGQLLQVPAAGGTPKPLTDMTTSDSYPAYTPDGRYIIHSSDRGGATNLWRIRADGSGTPERITSGPGDDVQPSVSRDGRRIAFSNFRADPQIVAVDPASAEQTELAVFEGGTGWGPDLAPDGSSIAFARKVPGRLWEIMLLPRQGGVARSLVALDVDLMWPRFHPDGRRLLFFTWAPGRQRIGSIELEGGQLNWLTAEGSETSYPAISPDGSQLAYVRAAGDREDIVLRPFDGGDERLIVESATLPTFSPDGRRLAFARSRSLSSGVEVVDLASGEIRRLSARGTWPTWLPDGSGVAFADRIPDGPQEAWIVPLDGSRPRKLTDFRWIGIHYPFTIDPRSGELISSNTLGGKSTIWLAEYD